MNEERLNERAQIIFDLCQYLAAITTHKTKTKKAKYDYEGPKVSYTAQASAQPMDSIGGSKLETVKNDEGDATHFPENCNIVVESIVVEMMDSANKGLLDHPSVRVPGNAFVDASPAEVNVKCNELFQVDDDLFIVEDSGIVLNVGGAVKSEIEVETADDNLFVDNEFEGMLEEPPENNVAAMFSKRGSALNIEQIIGDEENVVTEVSSVTARLDQAGVGSNSVNMPSELDVRESFHQQFKATASNRTALKSITNMDFGKLLDRMEKTTQPLMEEQHVASRAKIICNLITTLPPEKQVAAILKIMKIAKLYK